MARRDFRADKPLEMGDTIVVPPMRHSILVEGAVTRVGKLHIQPDVRRPRVHRDGGRTHAQRT